MYFLFTVYPNWRDNFAWVGKSWGNSDVVINHRWTHKAVFPSFKLNLFNITIKFSVCVVDCIHEWEDKSDDEFYHKECKNCSSWRSIPHDELQPW